MLMNVIVCLFFLMQWLALQSLLNGMASATNRFHFSVSSCSFYRFSGDQLKNTAFTGNIIFHHWQQNIIITEFCVFPTLFVHQHHKFHNVLVLFSLKSLASNVENGNFVNEWMNEWMTYCDVLHEPASLWYCFLHHDFLAVMWKEWLWFSL